LTNAKDAIQANKITHGKIHIHIARHDNLASVSVRDNAGGIPTDILPKIFDPYFTTKEKGTGIGLYMSKMIIEDSMDGKIEVLNVEGGAEFTVICPVARGDLDVTAT
ncbi:MAG: ATP-binding protein, partial [Sulfuricellaceae bacterium]